MKRRTFLKATLATLGGLLGLKPAEASQSVPTLKYHNCEFSYILYKKTATLLPNGMTGTVIEVSGKLRNTAGVLSRTDYLSVLDALARMFSCPPGMKRCRTDHCINLDGSFTSKLADEQVW